MIKDSRISGNSVDSDQTCRYAANKMLSGEIDFKRLCSNPDTPTKASDFSRHCYIFDAFVVTVASRRNVTALIAKRQNVSNVGQRRHDEDPCQQWTVVRK